MSGRGQYGRHAFHGHDAPAYGRGGYRRVDHAPHWGLSWRPHQQTIGGDAPHVGIHWTLSPIADRTRVVDQLTAEINTLYNELMREMGTDANALDPSMMLKDPQRFLRARAAVEKSPLYPIWRDVLSPFLKEWNDFHRGYSEWSEFLWLTNWDKLEDYAARWHAIYDKVSSEIHALGGRLHAPPPAQIPEDVLDKVRDFLKTAAEKAGGAVGDVWNVAKYGLIAALGIGGIYAVSKLVEKGKS